MNILVTGGSSGLGKSIVCHAAAIEGNNIYFTYRSHHEESVDIENKFSNTKAIYCDFGNVESVNLFLEQISLINPDALINNAYCGYALGNHFHKTPINDFESAFNLNIIPTIQITQKVIEVFRKKRAGKIVTVLTSALLNVPPSGYSVYSATKAYLAQLVKSWSKEYIKYGVTSNAVSPDFMQTELTKNTNELVIEQILNQHPLNKLLTTDEVADVVLSLLQSSAQINGVNIPVNAGINIL